MDPNAVLKELRELAESYDYKLANATLDAREIDSARMVELFEALDTWIAKSGFLPEAWTGEADGPDYEFTT